MDADMRKKQLKLESLASKDYTFPFFTAYCTKKLELKKLEKFVNTAAAETAELGRKKTKEIKKDIHLENFTIERSNPDFKNYEKLFINAVGKKKIEIGNLLANVWQTEYITGFSKKIRTIFDDYDFPHDLTHDSDKSVSFSDTNFLQKSKSLCLIVHTTTSSNSTLCDS